jgi:hypothetical protein
MPERPALLVFLDGQRLEISNLKWPRLWTETPVRLLVVR